MKVLTSMHHYALAAGQELKFTKRDEFGSVVIGTTNEDVLEVLIHRLREQNRKLPCRENSIAITKLEEGKMWLEVRMDKRRAQKLEDGSVGNAE